MNVSVSFTGLLYRTAKKMRMMSSSPTFYINLCVWELHRKNEKNTHFYTFFRSFISSSLLILTILPFTNFYFIVSYRFFSLLSIPFTTQLSPPKSCDAISRRERNHDIPVQRRITEERREEGECLSSRTK